MDTDTLTLIAVVIVNLLGLGTLWGKIRQEVTALVERHAELKAWIKEELDVVENGYRSGLTRVDNRVNSLETKIFDHRGKAQFMDVDEMQKFERLLNATAGETRDYTKNLVTGLTDTIKKYYEVATTERADQRSRIDTVEKRLLALEHFCQYHHKDEK